MFGIGIYNAEGVTCYGTNTQLEDYEPAAISGEGEVAFAVDRLELVDGTYKMDVAVHKRDGYPYDYHRLLYTFRVNSRTKRHRHLPAAASLGVLAEHQSGRSLPESADQREPS